MGKSLHRPRFSGKSTAVGIFEMPSGVKKQKKHGRRTAFWAPTGTRQNDHVDKILYIRFSEVQTFQTAVLRGIPENIQCLLVLLVDSGKALRLFSVIQLLCHFV